MSLTLNWLKFTKSSPRFRCTLASNAAFSVVPIESHSGPSLWRTTISSGADPENELGGGQFRGSGDGSPPAGSRGEAPVEGLGD